MTTNTKYILITFSKISQTFKTRGSSHSQHVLCNHCPFTALHCEPRLVCSSAISDVALGDLRA